MRTLYQLQLSTCSIYYPTREEAEDMLKQLQIGFINEIKADIEIAKFLLLNEGV